LNLGKNIRAINVATHKLRCSKKQQSVRQQKYTIMKNQPELGLEIILKNDCIKEGNNMFERIF